MEYFTVDDIAKGTYDQRDVDRLNTDDPYVRCFLRTLKAKGNPKKAVEVIHECFCFRKGMDLWGRHRCQVKLHVIGLYSVYMCVVYKGGSASKDIGI